jgi:hypothetical protein
MALVKPPLVTPLVTPSASSPSDKPSLSLPLELLVLSGCYPGSAVTIRLSDRPEGTVITNRRYVLHILDTNQALRLIPYVAARTFESYWGETRIIAYRPTLITAPAKRWVLHVLAEIHAPQPGKCSNGFGTQQVHRARGNLDQQC